MSKHYDIVMVTDCRFPGGTTASLVEEITAQSRAGYTTAVAHVPGPMVRGRHPFSPKLLRAVRNGHADLLLPDEQVHARLALLRHPAVFQRPPERAPKVTADVRVLAVNQPPRDSSQDEPYYDVTTVADVVEVVFGGDVIWAPIGPLVRDAIAGDANQFILHDTDWANILDAEAFRTRREGFVGDLPVLGRHSRPSYRKWPHTVEDTLAAYPDRPDMLVRILGGAPVPERLLGRVPENWTVYPFNGIGVREFLRRIDFCVYYHHPGWVEAFGRTILEALAAGAVAIVPEHFRRLFGPACLYGPPSQVQPTVQRLFADRDAFLAQSRAGQDYVLEHFSYHTHVRRVEALIGPPETPKPAAPKKKPHRDTVVFLSSNGAGVGHLMRLMSYARRASDRIQPLFFTLSQAVPIVRQLGFPVEYLGSRATSDISIPEWNALFHRRLGEIITTYDPAAIVFDGTWPYKGMMAAATEHPSTAFIWSRRAMWKQVEQATEILSRAHAFELVIEPGEFAAVRDTGPTTTVPPDEVTRVDPILFLDADELLGERAARDALGLDPDRPAALVQLGAGNINDISSTLGIVLQRLLAEPGLQVCVTKAIIAAASTDAPGDIVELRGVYPLAKYLRAFDFAVAASGYNSFHELVGFGLPTVFVPNMETRTDDQHARAAHAEEVGVGLCADGDDADQLVGCLETMLDPDRRKAMAEQAAAVWPGNGAAAAMAAITELVAARRGAAS